MYKVSRLEANRKILQRISEFIEKYPDVRFGQALVNLNIIELEETPEKLMAKDPFNEESVSTFIRMKYYT